MKQLTLAKFLVLTGILIVVYATLYTIPQVEGAKAAGGPVHYLDGIFWTRHIPFLIWGFSFPVGIGLIAIGAALRKLPNSMAFAISAPSAYLIAILVAFTLVTFSTRTPLFFGIGGTINAIGIVTTLFLGAQTIRVENPWPGMLKLIGYLSFAITAWTACGLLSTPGAVMFPELAQDQTTIMDLGQKLQVAWVVSWTITALGHVLEWRSQESRETARKGQEATLPAALAAKQLASVRD